ncbi:MAG: 16S rRNA (adenine(1518)-N(6)/adenine(1519)-N(6))-dimethyltransferase RsmA [Chlamydiota bacterium]
MTDQSQTDGNLFTATTPSGLKRILAQFEVKPKKQLSQSFLIDRNILKKIHAAAALSEEDFIIEIGSGPGALTEKLLQSGARILAIEKDPKLYLATTRLITPKLELLCADFLDLQLENLLKSRLQRGQKAKVISNIPYHLTSPILQRLLPSNEVISTAVVMMQSEVAQRCLAPPCSKDYSALSLFVQLYSNPKFLFHVKPTAFYPPPTITSTVIYFDLKPFPKAMSPQSFFPIVKAAFHQRRKTLKRSLASLFGAQAVTSALKTLDLPPLARPEELSPQAFLRFALQLKDQVKHSS